MALPPDDAAHRESDAEWRATCRTAPGPPAGGGLVPTMGALHDGHRSLVVRAADECDVVAACIFVNPLQFGHSADMARYPRTWRATYEMCAGAGGDVVFAPSRGRDVPGVARAASTTCRCAASARAGRGAPAGPLRRRGHRGDQLFSWPGRCRAYFGEKDFQQLAVVRRMAARPVAAGRGRRLSHRPRARRARPVEPQRAAVGDRARGRHRALAGAGRRPGRPAAASARAGRRRGHARRGCCRAAGGARLRRRGRRRHLEELGPSPPNRPGRSLRLLIAAQVGPVRLIDNGDALTTADDVRTVPGATEGAPTRKDRVSRCAAA